MARAFPLALLALVAGGTTAAPLLEAAPSASVAISGVVCIDEDRDGACGQFDMPVGLEPVDLIGPDGRTLASTITGTGIDGYEFTGLPLLPLGESYRVRHDRSGHGDALVLATAGGVAVTDPSVGIAVARELPNDGDRDDTLDFTLVRTSPGTDGFEISAAQTSTPQRWLQPATFSLTVENMGAAPLTNVTVTASTGPVLEVVEDAISGPLQPAGNGDDVLDVGERWVYEAVVPAISLVFDASAQRADTTIESSAFFQFGEFPSSLDPPVEIVTELDAPAVVGERAQWTVSARNQVDDDLVVVRGESRLLFADREGGVSFVPFGAPVDRGDGDEILAPGESWRWRAEHNVQVQGSYLDGSLTLRLADARSLYGFRLTSDPVVFEPAETPPPSSAPAEPTQQLPSTGRSGDAAMLALVILSAGVLMVITARIRVRPEAQR